MLRRVRAYTLLEILIVLAVLAGATIGVLRLFSMSDVKAEAQKEQRSISALVEAVRGVYAASPSYEGVDMALVAKEASLRGVLRASGGLPVSAFSGDLLTVRSATVRVPDDAFSITVGGLDRKACAAVIPALAGETTQVATISGGNIQATPHRVPDAAAIATACAGGFFQKGTGSVSLVYYRPRATGNAVARGPSCAVSCAPQTETQTIGCPTGQTGQINQTRENTCSNDACPVPIVGSWTTVSSSCAAPAAPTTPVVPTAPKDPGLACTPRVQVRSLGCPQPQLGRINQQQAITCDAGGQHLGPWTTVSDTCLPPPLPCTSGVLTGADACPAGQFGQVSWFQDMTCTGGGLSIGPKKITGNSCATVGTCRPSSRPGATTTTACPAGQVGQITNATTEYSTCASATALPVWGPAQTTGTSNTCTVASCTPSGGGVWSVNVVSMKVGPIGGTPTSSPYDTVYFTPSTGVAYMKTAPTTSRFLASGNVVFDMTVGAQTQQFTVACTQANSVLNSPTEHITDECLYTGSVSLGGITLDITVDAGGLPAQDWVAGQPAGPVSVQATIAQSGGCTPPPPAPTPACSGAAGAPSVSVSPIDLTVDQIGSQGAVAGAYGSTTAKAGWTGSAKAQITYNGYSQTVAMTCTSGNNTSGTSAQCVGPTTDITLGGQVFGVNVIVSGPTPSVPTMGQGKYWSANVNVKQTGCVHWITRCNALVSTSTPWNGGSFPLTDGKGVERPVEGQVINNPVAVMDNGNGTSGDGPNGNPWSVFCNITGQVADNAPYQGTWGLTNNPGYGKPTNPWASLYSSNAAGNFTGPAPQPGGDYGTYLNQTCAMGQDRLFYTPWVVVPNGGTEQVLYVGQSCSVAPMYVWGGATGEPAPPSGCPTSASAKPIGHDATPQMAPPPGC